MVESLRLLRNVGQFDSVDEGAQLPFSKLTLIYAENGRGKTTLASILRSLGNGAATLIEERRRLASANPPHIVIAAGGATHVFQNGAWSTTQPSIAVFDDAFVSQNVCSGIEIDAEHRQNLHELILGVEGVTLNAAVQEHVRRVEEHNRTIRDRSQAIPASMRGDMNIDAFCALANNPNLALDIRAAERNLATATSSEAIARQEIFVAPAIPTFDTEAINSILGRDLPSMEAEASMRVQAHLEKIGDRAGAWIAEGMERIADASEGLDHRICPFCTQDLEGSAVIGHYQAYFSEAYANLKAAIADTIRAVHRAHGGDVPAAFERSVLNATQNAEFWGQFTDVPAIDLDTAAISRAWREAREATLAALQQKQATPLESMTLPLAAEVAVGRYEDERAAVIALQAALEPVNAEIALVKERAATPNVPALTADLRRLKVNETRFRVDVIPLCDSYLSEKRAKVATEAARDRVRDALDEYRITVFPAYETAINTYLTRFNAGFRLSAVQSINNRGGSSCTYNVVINNVEVPVTTDVAGTPTFRSTLSAGDRNTLALAFFFASLDRDANLAEKIVVIDDPMTSLDEHRNLTTVQETRRLIGRVARVIVLSHSKAFLCKLWEGADRTERASIKITRNGHGQNAGSVLTSWDVHQDCITEHDRGHALVTSYIAGTNGVDERAVAVALRPILESFFRVAYPGDFPPGTLLGPFLGVCDQRTGTDREILSAVDITELRDLLDYANRFHHQTNPGQTEIINDTELLQFAKRTMAFSRRP